MPFFSVNSHKVVLNEVELQIFIVHDYAVFLSVKSSYTGVFDLVLVNNL